MTDIADLVAKLDAPADIPRLTDDELTALLVAHAKGMGGLCWNIHHRDLRPPEWPCETWRLATEVRELRAVKDAAKEAHFDCDGQPWHGWCCPVAYALARYEEGGR